MNLIVLTIAQAAAVRGRSADEMSELVPIELEDGTFALPAEVIADRAHTRHLAALEARPRRPLVEARWKLVPEPKHDAAPPPRAGAAKPAA